MTCRVDGTKLVRLLWTAGLVVIVASPVVAQQRTTMTLDEALDVARDRNPAYQRARAQVDLAHMGVLAGWGAFLPNLNTSMSWNGNSQTQVTGTDDFGQTIVRDNPISFQRSSVSQSINGSVTLFDGFNNINQLRAARYDVTAADAGVLGQGVQVDAEVSRRFFGAIRANRLLELERQLLTSANERFEANERLFAVASASQVDLIGAEVDVAIQEQQLESQVGEARKARLSVLEQLGVLDELIDFDPEGDFPVAFDPAVLDADALVARATEVSPLLAQRRAQYGASERRASAARSARFPTVSAGAGFSRSLNEQQYGAFFNLNPLDRSFSFQLSVQWQVFNRFQISQQMAQFNVQRRQADEDLREARLQVERQVRSAYVDLDVAYEGLQRRRRAAELSRRRVELAREQYRQGSIAFINLQQINDQAANAERSLVNAEYDFAVALVTLEEQVGESVAGPQ